MMVILSSLGVFLLAMYLVNDSSLSPYETLRGYVLQWVATTWFFALGATIGSFLNVVIYRIPRGESVATRPSHCPYCDQKIKGKDNVPVLGWLVLNGRCRVCRLPISTRYPIVEFICGLIFLVFFFVEIVSGGWNIPGRVPDERIGIVYVLFGGESWDLVRLYLLHMFLAASLVSSTMIHWDDQKIPVRFWATIGCFVAIFVLIWPDLHPVSWCLFGWKTELPRMVNAATSLVMGSVCGVGIGMLIAQIYRWLGHSEGPKLSRGLSICLGLVGLFLGWQAVFAIGLIAVWFSLLAQLITFGRQWKLPWAGVVSVAVLVHHLLWRLLSGLDGWWLGTESDLFQVVLFAVVFVSSCLFCAWVTRTAHMKNTQS